MREGRKVDKGEMDERCQSNLVRAERSYGFPVMASFHLLSPSSRARTMDTSS